MTIKTKAALHRGNDNSALCQKQATALGRSGSIVSDYERGALIAGLIVAAMFGLMFLHAAVM